MALVELAQRIAAGEIISAVDFERIYFEIGSGGRKRIGDTFLDQIRYNTRLPLFDFSDRHAVQLAFDCEAEADISSIPLKVERIWCAAALCDDYAKLFFDPEAVQKLRSSLADTDHPYYDLIDNSACDMSSAELCAVQAVFRQSLDAVLHAKELQFQFCGDTVSGTPLRIIYDEKDKQFALLLRHGDAVDTYNMREITDLCETGTAERPAQSVLQLMAPYKAAEPIVIEITDYKNRRAIERAVITFSVYDHIVRIIDEKKAEITINYYTFDLDDAVRRVLSFGTDARIRSSDAAIAHLKKILKSV